MYTAAVAVAGSDDASTCMYASLGHVPSSSRQNEAGSHEASWMQCDVM